MSAIRRALWATVLLAWPAVVIVKAIWKPSWGGDLSDGGAAVTLMLGLALLRGRRDVPHLVARRNKRELAALRARVDEQQRQIAALGAGLARAFCAAGRDTPEAIQDHAETQPVLRVVG